MSRNTPAAAAATRDRLLESAINVIRAKGYTATTLDDVCDAAGVTKGGFFHHFKSKEDLAIAAARQFSDMADQLFGAASYHQLADPLARLLGYVAMRRSMVTADLPTFTCLLGTMAQETYQSHPAIREVCGAGIETNADMLEKDVALAMRIYGKPTGLSAASLAMYIQGSIQGSFVVAKAAKDPDLARQGLDHLSRYLQLLFGKSTREKKQ